MSIWLAGKNTQMRGLIFQVSFVYVQVAADITYFIVEWYGYLQIQANAIVFPRKLEEDMFKISMKI